MRILLLLSSLFCVSTMAYGQVIITTAFGDGADTYVKRSGPTSANADATTNFGNAAAVIVKTSGTGTSNAATNRVGILRFDLSGFSPGTGTAANDVTDATLRLTVSEFTPGTPAGTTPATSATFNLFGLLNAQAAENFTEGAGQTSVTGPTPPNPIVYANTPGLDDSADRVTNSTSIFANEGVRLAGFTVTQDDVGKTILVTSPELISFLNADTNNLATFFITRNSTGNSNADSSLGTTFASKENTTGLAAPSLMVVPEPGTVGMLAFAASLLALRRRRA